MKKDLKMKNKFIICASMALLTIILSAGTLSAKGSGKASMKFEQTTHNFGTIKENGGAVTCEFPFVNEGQGNLVIFNATAECGCTRPTYPKQPIAPGKSGVVKVTYNPIGRPGAFDKMVTIKTNGKPGKIRLKIKGTVMPK